MEAPCIVITDSDDSSESSSLGFRSDLKVLDIERIRTGNPQNGKREKRAFSKVFDENESVTLPRLMSCDKMSMEDVIIISSDSDDTEDVELQKAIVDSLKERYSPAMCSQDKCGGESTSTSGRGPDHAQGRTWSQRKTERLVHCNSRPRLDSTINISSEDSDTDCSDSLPDLDEFIPNFRQHMNMNELSFCDQKPVSLKKRLTVSGDVHTCRKDRHFLDTFQPSSKCCRVDKDAKCNIRAVCETASQTPETESNTTQKNKLRDRITQEMQAGSVPVYQEECKSFAFPTDSFSKSSTYRKASTLTEATSRRMKNKFSGVRFLQNMTTFPAKPDLLCPDFVKLQTSCLDDLSDDLSDPNNFLNCLDLLEEFCYNRKPHHALLDKIIENGFFVAVDEKMTVQSYQTVLNVWQRYPNLVKIEASSILLCGDVLHRHLQNHVSLSGNSSLRHSHSGEKGRPSFQQARLFFQLFIKGLQLDLGECTLPDQTRVNKSMTFALLSSEGSRTLIKQVMYWLEFCLVVRSQEHTAVARLWLWELQTVLEVSILVSRDQQEAAKKLALELKRAYKYLADMTIKKQLVQSFTSPLLCFYVLRLVMEDQCENTIVSSQFPSTIQEVVHNYYVALPPQDNMTPPLSPSEDVHAVAHSQSRVYSVQSCEELAVLIYFITKSFILCKTKRLDCDLRQQVLKGPNLAAVTKEQKRQFQDGIQEFGAHLRTLSRDLSAETITYLTLLECLTLAV